MSDALTDDPLATLEALLKEATQEPWAVNPFLAQIDAFVGGEPLAVCRMLWPTEERTEAETLANTALIAHLRNLAPALVEEIRTSRARVRALEEALKEAKIVAHAGRPIGGIVLVSQEYMLKRIVAIADRALTENTNG